MTEYNEGDLVEAVKGDTVIRGRVNRHGELNLTMALTSDMLHLKANGYTVTVVERATPPLPTEPGWYRSSCKSTTNVYRLDPQGQWREHASVYILPRTEAEMREFAPYALLEPVPVTAKRVLDRVRQHLDVPFDGRRPDGRFIITHNSLVALAAEFGVSDD